MCDRSASERNRLGPTAAVFIGSGGSSKDTCNVINFVCIHPTPNLNTQSQRPISTLKATQPQ